MGFFDRLTGRRPATPSSSTAPAAPETGTPAPLPAASPAPETTPSEPAAPAAANTGGVMPRLVTARECLEAKDLPGALAIYEEVLATDGDRADVLVTISADLGTNGFLREIIEHIAPRYDAERHGPATGINILQAYLAVGDAGAAQHVLDLLFALRRPELEERLYGFSNAIAELLSAQRHGEAATANDGAPGAPEPHKINVVSISKPIWFYGLEPLAGRILPPKSDRLRRIAFAQLATPGLPDIQELMKRPETPLGRFSRALPLWFAETFYFSPHYAPIAAVGVSNQQHYALFGLEWSTDNLRQLVATSPGLDYIFTGALREIDGDTELVLRVWEVRKFRERKQFTARWAPATMEAELRKLHEQVCFFMEWSPEKNGLPYVAPASPCAWLDTLAASLSLFLHEKNLLARDQVPPLEPLLASAAAAAPTNEAASLAFITLRNRAERLQLAERLDAALASSPLIADAAGVRS